MTTQKPHTDPTPNSSLIGTPTPRYDGRLKVTGAARYTSDHPVHRPVYAYLHVASIARGKIRGIDERAARAVNGVLEIFTYRNIDPIAPGKIVFQGGRMTSSIAPLQQQIHYGGQIVALIAAETYEAAREASGRLIVDYLEQPPAATFGSAGLTEDPGAAQEQAGVGNFATAFAAAPVQVSAHYSTPIQHHNPLELFATTCAWSNGKLTVWEGSQGVHSSKHGIAQQLSIRPEDVRIVSPCVGGAFGSRGLLTQRTAIVAIAARKLGRPVKLEPTRAQGFTIATYRSETEHHVQLGASRDGKLVALNHEGREISSRPDNFKLGGVDQTIRMYACPNVASKVTLLHANRNTPGFMRSPHETPYMFALESAMDELAHVLKMDPVELRRVNDTIHEPIKGLPYTSRRLMPCFDAAAKAFGWSARKPEPGSMREGDWLIGWGCASGAYPTQLSAATARVRLTIGGDASVQSATHEFGQGAYTAMAITVSDKLGVPIDRIDVQLGDSDLPPGPLAGGSVSTASVCTVVAKACEEIRAKLAAAAVKAASGPLYGADPRQLTLVNGTLKAPNGRSEPLHDAMSRVAGGAIEVYAENVPHGVPPQAVAMLYERGASTPTGGFGLRDRVQAAFGASFVEIRVHARTREIRVGRLVGAYAFGQVVNPTAAESQLMGGQIWGVSAALHEATEIDVRAARYTNTNFAEYLIPVNADIPSHQVLILSDPDTQVNDLGIKGVGELGNVGMNAAVANAVFHATGIRVRQLPIRLEKLLGSLSTQL